MTGGARVSKRLRMIPPYLFAEIDRMKNEAERSGADVIDLGVGDPDLGPPQAVVDSLVNNARREGTHHYSSYAGLPELRSSFAGWFKRRYGVTLDPDREVLPLLGSKEGIGHTFLALLDEGQEVLIPDPGYPVYTSGAVLAGGVPRYYPLRAERGFLPEQEELKLLVSRATAMMWINYPSNPTASLADVHDLERIAGFAADNDLVLCHDAAYAEIIFGDRSPVSLLQASGPGSNCIEFHSLSKTFCMPGWRVGFAVGDSGVIGALARVKTNLDSGIFMPVQDAAVTALTECEADIKIIRSIFESRITRFVEALRNMGWKVPLPGGTFYVWAPLPAGYDSMGFAAMLLQDAGILVTPGVGFGRHGEGFVRMSLTMPEERLDEVLERLRNLEVEW
ncbi:MAG: hypothetical protein AVO39_05100 [delta proteobacterium MLS_D]|jgi:LL-diaminopimelate aminotransferase|nr:MAG: hypothetical protein AVO39_05100 [delta proteobacterium MLS_D]